MLGNRNKTSIASLSLKLASATCLLLATRRWTLGLGYQGCDDCFGSHSSCLASTFPCRLQNKAMRRFLISLVGLFVAMPTHGLAQQLPPDHAQRMKAGTDLFLATIRPILLDRCIKCHGGEKVRGGLDLSSRQLLLKGGDSGEVINEQDWSDSYLLHLVRHDGEPTMPPSSDKLPNELIAQLERWIELGFPYDKPLIEKTSTEPAAMQVTDSDRDFWSFRPLARIVPPPVESEWPRTDLDHFVLHKLQEHDLVPNSLADNHARIRRAYLDLIGLPPTPEQLDAALKMAHEDLVDELLESPHYGERWARHWLDVARFAESYGFEQDYDRKFAYHYRDFVIKAFNADMPWNQFVRWQIAGDEIAPDDPLALMATGFLGAGVFPTQLTEKEFESARYDELDDMASTVGTAMLGLTVGCARCHDHKFDPLPVKDYYQFVSTFTTTIRSEVEIDLAPSVYQAKLSAWQASHENFIAARDAYRNTPEVVARFNNWLSTSNPLQADDSQWTVLEVATATTDQAATTLTPQPDGAIMASGNPPATETYTVVTSSASAAIRFVRVEALTDASMKRSGPGRADNGNFALSDLKLFATASDSAQSQHRELKLISARATHQQNTSNLSVAAAIDEDPSGTGWAVDLGGIGMDQAAVFELATPIESSNELGLEFQLTFANNAQHSLGRFRLSISNAAEPTVAVGDGRTNAMRDALAAWKQGNLQSQHKEVLFPLFATDDPHWIELGIAVEKSLSQKPSRSMTTVQVSSEGFPPTKHHADERGFPHFYPETHFLKRGDANQKEDVAEPGFLQVLMRNGRTSADWQQTPPPNWMRTSFRRTGMANWIIDTNDGAGHLLARVIVNRIWQHHFGRGIVATPNDFGLQGTPPTHPELLDFLAQRLIDGGWKLKPIHREILLSATWLQSSIVLAKNADVDPENQWLSHYPIRRLEAEVVRDAMLAVSGQLDTTMFGPGTLDPSQRRRSIYFMIKRSRLVPMMQIFDQPEPLSSQGSRPSTTIAPQALLFMNNSDVLLWATAFASSVDNAKNNEAIRQIYYRALSRQPTEIELQQSLQFVEEQAASYQSVENRNQIALADLCQVIFGLNEFIYLP